jgi:hypothetical protein
MQQQQQQPAKLSVNDQLQSDITKFEERALQAARDRNLSATEEAGGGAIGRIKSAFSAVLIADFFVVIAFLVWFLVRAFLIRTCFLSMHLFLVWFIVRVFLICTIFYPCIYPRPKHLDVQRFHPPSLFS